MSEPLDHLDDQPQPHTRVPSPPATRWMRLRGRALSRRTRIALGAVVAVVLLGTFTGAQAVTGGRPWWAPGRSSADPQAGATADPSGSATSDRRSPRAKTTRTPGAVTLTPSAGTDPGSSAAPTTGASSAPTDVPGGTSSGGAASAGKGSGAKGSGAGSGSSAGGGASAGSGSSAGGGSPGTGSNPAAPPVVHPPGSSATNCAARPSRCGYPDESNTGVPPGVTLTPSGSVTASTPGQVIDGLDITGEINVTAPDVVIKNTRVTGGRGAGAADWVVIVRPDAHNLTIVDSELTTPAGSAQDIACVLNIGDSSPTIRRANIHRCSAGISSGGGLVEHSYIHDMAQVAGLSHDVGIASNGGGGMTIRHNTVFNQLDQTAAIAFYQDFQPVQRNNLVEDNLLAGGGYCLYGGDGKFGATSDIRFVNNRLSRHLHPNCGSYGVIASFTAKNPGNAFTGNYWDDDLSAVR